MGEPVSEIAWFIYAGVILLSFLMGLFFLFKGRLKKRSIALVLSVLLVPMLTVLHLTDGPYPANEAVFIFEQAASFEWRALLITALHLYILIWWVNLAFASF